MMNTHNNNFPQLYGQSWKSLDPISIASAVRSDSRSFQLKACYMSCFFRFAADLSDFVKIELAQNAQNAELFQCISEKKTWTVLSINPIGDSKNYESANTLSCACTMSRGNLSCMICIWSGGFIRKVRTFSVWKYNLKEVPYSALYPKHEVWRR